MGFSGFSSTFPSDAAVRWYPGQYPYVPDLSVGGISMPSIDA